MPLSAARRIAAGHSGPARPVAEDLRKLDPGQVIKPMAFYSIFRRFNKHRHDRKTFKGHRLYAVDGTCINVPQNPAAPSFVCNGGTP